MSFAQSNDKTNSNTNTSHSITPENWLQQVSDACFQGDSEGLNQLLLQRVNSPSPKQFNINRLDKNNQLSPVHRACSRNQSNILLQLLELDNLDLKIKDKVEATPLHLAVANNAIDCVVILTSTKYAKQLIECKDCYGKTPFKVAFVFRNYEVMKILIQAYGNDIVNMKTTSSLTCLHIAARDYDLKAIKFLLENGAKILKDENGKTPLGECVSKTKLKSTKESKTSCKMKPYATTLSLVADDGNEKKKASKYADYLCYSLLMEEEISKFGLNKWMTSMVDINNGRNIIQVACEVGNSRFLTLCALSLPKEVYQKMLMATDKKGRNSLHLACENGHYEIVRQVLLLLKDVNRNEYLEFINQQENVENNTPFHCAIMALKRAELNEGIHCQDNDITKVNEEINKISKCIVELFDNPCVNYDLRNCRNEKIDDLLPLTTFFSQMFLGCKSSARYTKRVTASKQ